MAKNAQLLQALTNLNKATPDSIKALDDLVKAGATAKNFRDAIIANKEFWKSLGVEEELANYKDEEGFLVAAGENNPHDSFATMHKLAAEKRVILGLQSASEDVLKSLIALAHHQPLRAALAVDPVATAIGNIHTHTAPGWNAADEVVITNDATDRIQLEAQYQLLLKKINECKAVDGVKLDALFKAIRRANDAEFKAAAQALGVDVTSVDKMAHNGVGDRVKAAVAKKNFSFFAQLIFNEKYVLNDPDETKNPHKVLQLDDRDFKAALLDPYNLYIADEDVPYIRGLLSEKYIPAKIASMDLDGALKIAKTTNTVQLRLQLGGQAYLDSAVTEQNESDIRNTAAIRFLKLQIEKSDDLSALRSLAATRTLNEWNNVLEAAPSLGFAGEPGKELRKVFKDNRTVLQALIPAAHVRSNVLAGNVDDLQKLIKDEVAPNAFRDKYFRSFHVDASITHLFDAYFNNPANRFMLRQQALLRVAKAKFSELPIDKLNEILNAQTGEDLHDAVVKHLGIDDDSVAGLIADANEPYKMLKAYAYMELQIKSAPTADFDTLLKKINGLAAKDKVSSIPESDIIEAQKKLAKILLEKCPATKPELDDLVKLTQAKNLAEMGMALQGLGVTDRGWLSVENMQELRKAALPRAIELKMDAESTIGKGARPQLLALFKTFSLEKQQALLADDKLIKAVMTAEPANLVKMLKIKSSLVARGTPLHAEFERIRLSGRIQNAAIGQIIAGMPSVVLTSEKINNINTILNDATLDWDANKFKNEICQKILTVVSPSDAAAFHKGFGLDPLGAQYQDGEAAVRAVIAQQGFNELTIGKRQGPASSEKGVYEFIATLNKGAGLSIANGDKIVEAFNDATSKKDLLVKINAIDPVIEATTLKSFEQKLTQNMYNTLKHPFAKALFLDPAKLVKALKDSRDGLITSKAEVKELADIDGDIRDELRRLSELTAASWLDPAFQSAAHRNAHAMKQQFTELSKVCDIVVTNLADKQAFYQEKLNSLPSQAEMGVSLNPAQKRSVETHRVELANALTNVSNGLDRYTKLQTVLKGNPNEENPDLLTSKGLLNALDDAMSGRPVKFLSYETNCVKYPKSQMQAHLQRGYEGAKAESMDTVVGMCLQDKPYGVDPKNTKLGKDEFFEHTIGMGTDEGYFIEERGPRDQKASFKPGIGGGASAVNFPIEVKLTPTKLPSTPAGLIQTSMAIASRLLAGERPSLDNKILLQCTDGKKARHLWTALMAQMMAQGISAKDAKSFIVVRSPFFDPEKEMGMIYGLSGDSLYETDYKTNDTVTSYQKDMKQLTDDKDASEKSKAEVSSFLNSAASRFKDSKNVINNLKTKNDDNENEPPSIRIR